jgi:hypothetical protein
MLFSRQSAVGGRLMIDKGAFILFSIASLFLVFLQPTAD